MCTKEDVNRLTSRRIAKLLTDLNGSITTLVEQRIKKEMRYLEQDISALLDDDEHQIVTRWARTQSIVKEY